MNLDDFCILYVDSLPSRIYLQTLINLNLKPAKIINLKISPNRKSYKIVKSMVGNRLAMAILKYYIRRIRFPRIISPVAIDTLSQFDIDYLNLRVMDVHKLGIQTIDVYVNSINSQRVVKELENISETKILFTGGGILRSDILRKPNKLFFHIHPGFVPEVRGADCILWSFLTRKKFGYSVFLMNEGIDMGDVLYREEFSVKILSERVTELSDNDFYFYLLNFLDPCLRITAFCNMLKFKPEIFDVSDKTKNRFSAIEQNPSDGRTFYFMHRRFRELVQDKLRGYIKDDNV